MKRKAPSNEIPKLSELIPERIAKLLGEPPILPFEKASDFEALHAEFVVQHNPKDIVDHISVRDLAETRWEVMRLRCMRRAAIENGLPAAAAQLVPRQLFKAAGKEPIGSTSDAERIAKGIVRKAARGSDHHQKCLLSVIGVGGVTKDMLTVVAYARDLRTISAIDEAISVEQHRFDQILRNLENRRKINTTMARSFSGKSDEIVDVDVANADAEDEVSS